MPIYFHNSSDPSVGLFAKLTCPNSICDSLLGVNISAFRRNEIFSLDLRGNIFNDVLACYEILMMKSFRFTGLYSTLYNCIYNAGKQ